MADLLNIIPTSIKPLMDKMSYYKFNPGMIQSSILDYLYACSGGEVDLVDPTNPFVFLLESSAVATSAAILENARYLRMQYPSLASTEEELYIHLSDKDIVNRFARPAKTTFDVVMYKADIDNKLNWDSVNGYWKVVIPRNTEVTVAGVTFSIQYPIEIRKMLHGGILIVYDTSVTSPLMDIENNVIPYEINRDDKAVEWVLFSIPMLQLKSDSVELPINDSVYFNETISFTDKFHYARVYYRKDNVSKTWNEISITLTEQVFDIDVPTAILKVYESSLTVSIPKIYLTNGVIGGIIRIDIFTTKGAISFNTSSYSLSEFVPKFKALDRDRDNTVFSSNISSMVMVFSNKRLVSGGENGLSFEELKSRLIYNSLSGNRLPITNVQMSNYLEDLGFRFVANTDVVTNRIFVASRKMVLPDNNSIYTPTDAVILTFISNLDSLKNRDRVIDNGERVTILSNTVFISENGQLRMMDDVETAAINSYEVNMKLEELNTEKYFLLPFYYVLDGSLSEFDARAYHLDKATANKLNYIDSNGSFNYYVNVGSYLLDKIPGGYRLVITTASDDTYKSLGDSTVGVYLSFTANNESDLCYIAGRYVGRESTSKERIFEILLNSSLDIDADDLINIDNVKIYSDNLTTLRTGLETVCNICFVSFESDTVVVPNIHMNKYIPDFIEPVTTNAISLYKLNLKFGDNLKTLWKQSRSYTTTPIYKRYDTNIPLLYTEDVYNIDPTTGSQFKIVNGAISYEILHHKGDIVYDSDGTIMYKHKVGDVVLDENNNPVPIGGSHIYRMVDIFLLDARYYFSNEAYSRSYLDLVVDSVVTWVTETLADVSNILLEQTKLYFKPVNSRGYINVYNDSKEVVSINAAQQLTITYYVNGYVYNNPDLRSKIRSTTIIMLNTYLNKDTVSLSEIISDLQSTFSRDVISLSITGLGGDSNYNTIKIINPDDSLSLQKNLFRLSDNSLAVRESIKIDFVQSV